jgi:hypothetical protein
MIDWVDTSCKAWGRCTRWILADTNEGYPSMDTIARARNGYLDMKGTVLSGKFGEVRVGEALEIARALAAEPLMPEALQATLWAQYVVRIPSKGRAALVGTYLATTVTIAEYWRNLDRAHHFLAGRLPKVAPRGTSCFNNFNVASINGTG